MRPFGARSRLEPHTGGCVRYRGLPTGYIHVSLRDTINGYIHESLRDAIWITPAPFAPAQGAA
jgi:hypothetical protein